MSYLQACVLGCLQGLAEFLPISSSAHLLIAQKYLGVHLDEGQILFDLVLHLGTLFAILFVFRRDIKIFLKDPCRLRCILLSLLPTIVLGLMIAQTSSFFVQIPVVACMLILNAAVLWRGHSVSKNGHERSMSKRQALWIGLAQGCAVIPGLSRSGLTISTALGLKLNASEAFSYSFILAIPTILMAFGYEFVNHFSQLGTVEFGPLLLGFFVSFLVGLGSLFLLKIIFSAKRLDIFSYYCIVLGVLVLLKGW